MTHRWSNVRTAPFRNASGASYAHRLQGAATCDQCGSLSVGIRSVVTTSPTYEHAESAFDAATDLTWYPTKVHAPSFDDVPPPIAQAAQEVHTAHAINAPMAAILMARTVVEATAKDKGTLKGTLVAKIDAMEAQGLLRRDTKEAAHAIRHVGNDMAHGDLEPMPTNDDVQDVLELMDEVLREVFQGPAVTARLKARRSAGGLGSGADGTEVPSVTV